MTLIVNIFQTMDLLTNEGRQELTMPSSSHSHATNAKRKKDENEVHGWTNDFEWSCHYYDIFLAQMNDEYTSDDGATSVRRST